MIEQEEYNKILTAIAKKAKELSEIKGDDIQSRYARIFLFLVITHTAFQFIINLSIDLKFHIPLKWWEGLERERLGDRVFEPSEYEGFQDLAELNLFPEKILERLLVWYAARNVLVNSYEERELKKAEMETEDIQETIESFLEYARSTLKEKLDIDFVELNSA